jgi:hypothetical protein
MATTTVTRCTVKRTMPKATVLDITIESVKNKSSDGDNGQDARDAERAKGSVFTVTLNEAGKVAKLAGFDAYVKKLADGDEDKEKVLRSGAAETNLKKSIEETFDFLPGRAVSKGDTWKQEAVTPNTFGSFKVVKTFTYDGLQQDRALISFTSNMTYVPPAEGGVLKVVKGALKAEEAKGTFAFDADKGRLIHGKNHVLIRGNLTVDFMERQQNMELMVDLRSSITVSATKPALK